MFAIEIPLDNILKLWMKLWFDENALSMAKLYPPEENFKSANFMLGFLIFRTFSKMKLNCSEMILNYL